jgi:hypothetical protein
MHTDAETPLDRTRTGGCKNKNGRSNFEKPNRGKKNATKDKKHKQLNQDLKE